MSDPYVGEIRLFAFGRVPTGWAPCNGQSLSISQNQVLYTLIGTTYGGDGVQTFNVPDLRGRVPICFGQGTSQPSYPLGQRGGEEQHTLNTQEMAAHSHSLTSSTAAANSATPANSVHLATINPTTKTLYAALGNIQSYQLMAPISVAQAGSNLPHDNMMPSLTMNFCIALVGVFPSS